MVDEIHERDRDPPGSLALVSVPGSWIRSVVAEVQVGNGEIAGFLTAHNSAFGAEVFKAVCTVFDTFGSGHWVLRMPAFIGTDH